MLNPVTPEMLTLRVAKNLRRLRRDRGLSRDMISQQCQCHPDTIANYERGLRTSFEGLAILIRAAAVLGVRLDDLLAG
jgi:transcriptional regulator with XRE-family HTH domain